MGQCRYGDSCAYQHRVAVATDVNKSSEARQNDFEAASNANTDLKRKMEELKNMMEEKNAEIDGLRNEVEALKVELADKVEIERSAGDNRTDSELLTEELNFDNRNEDNNDVDDEAIDDMIEEEVILRLKYPNDEVKNGNKESENMEVKCDMCDYKVGKRITLNKHINTKHGGKPDVELGSGRFGFTFDVRAGMEEEAVELRSEWSKSLDNKTDFADISDNESDDKYDHADDKDEDTDESEEECENLFCQVLGPGMCACKYLEE